jgi:hypothetical protein
LESQIDSTIRGFKNNFKQTKSQFFFMENKNFKPRLDPEIEMCRVNLWKRFEEMAIGVISQNNLRENPYYQAQNPWKPQTIGLDSDQKQRLSKLLLSRNAHSPLFHSDSIWQHSVLVDKNLRLILDEYCQEDFVDSYFAQKVEGVSKYNLFRLAPIFHDIGKLGGTYCRLDNDGNCKLKKVVRRGETRQIIIPEFGFSNHEAISGDIMEDKSSLPNQILADDGFSNAQIKYIADCCRFHFELGIIREKAKEYPLGLSDYLETENFILDILELFEDKTKKEYWLEIILFFKADTDGKYSSKIREIITGGLDGSLDQAQINRNLPKALPFAVRIDPSLKNLLDESVKNPSLVFKDQKELQTTILKGIIGYPANQGLFQKSLQIARELFII